MAKENKGPKAQTPPMGGNVVALPAQCPVEKCKSKPRRAGFCEEHFMWFKEGLISRDGEKPKDFDKKYQSFLRKTKVAA